MKRVVIPILFIISLFISELKAQNPFEKYGYHVKVLTMTNGKFNEFFDLDSIQQVGDVLINTNTMKVIGIAEKDSINPMPDAQLISRWISPDPLAEEYYYISPYNYTLNNPIIYIDPNGEYVDWYVDQDDNLVHVPDATGEIKGTTLTWIAPEGAGISDEIVVTADVETGNQSVTSKEPIEMTMYDVAESPKYNTIKSAVYKGQKDFVRNYTPVGIVMYAGEFVGGVSDFKENYQDMKDANWNNSDKYFHCKANYQATKRGPGGEFAAEKMSNLREITDQRIKGDPRSASIDDQKANKHGRNQAKTDLKNCKPCQEFRPKKLPQKY